MNSETIQTTNYNTVKFSYYVVFRELINLARHSDWICAVLGVSNRECFSVRIAVLSRKARVKCCHFSLSGWQIDTLKEQTHDCCRFPIWNILHTSSSAERNGMDDEEGDELKNDQNNSKQEFPEPTFPSSGDTSMMSKFLNYLVSRWGLCQLVEGFHADTNWSLRYWSFRYNKCTHCGVMIVSCADQRCIELHSSKSPFSW